jgi:hypothetical protein
MARTIADIAEEARELPTEYFEAKPRRIVDFGEVKAVIVPDNVSLKTFEELEERGIPVYEYGNGEGERLAAVNKAADEVDVKFKLSEEEAGTQKTLKQTIQENAEAINATEAVADIPAEYLTKDKYAIIDEVIERLKGSDYDINSELGTVHIDRKQLKGGLAYRLTGAERAAIAAIPDVIENGQAIREIENHKSRGYGSFVLAAKINVAGNEGIMGVAVKKTKGANRYNAHRVITPDGKVLNIEQSETQPSNADRTVESGFMTEKAVSDTDTITQAYGDVNSKNEKKFKVDEGAGAGKWRLYGRVYEIFSVPANRRNSDRAAVRVAADGLIEMFREERVNAETVRAAAANILREQELRDERYNDENEYNRYAYENLRGRKIYVPADMREDAGGGEMAGYNRLRRELFGYGIYLTSTNRNTAVGWEEIAEENPSFANASYEEETYIPEISDVLNNVLKIARRAANPRTREAMAEEATRYVPELLDALGE